MSVSALYLLLNINNDVKSRRLLINHNVNLHPESILLSGLDFAFAEFNTRLWYNIMFCRRSTKLKNSYEKNELPTTTPMTDGVLTDYGLKKKKMKRELSTLDIPVQ